MASKRNVKVETPGTTASDDATPPTANAAPAAIPDASTPDSAPEVPVAPAAASLSPEAQEKAAKDAALVKQLEQTKPLVGSSAALDWSHLTQPATIATKLSNAEADLPNDADIDPFKIPFGQKVLTRQGWVLSTVPDPRDRRV
jgi:hypothetical protein